MNSQAYDAKNEQNFNDVTERINEALLKIASDSSIKATVTELAEIAGVHRNTINNREWPAKRLKAIKAERKAEWERKTQKTDTPNPLHVLTSKLQMARLETLHWFNQYNEVRAFYEGAQENVKYLSKTRESHKQEVQALQGRLRELEQEYERVCDLLNTMTVEVK
ncbi:MAG: hypothetical protein FH754_15980 [Marinobacter sp.]|nr:hypothetical protein [Marinobacter sp.]